MTTTTQKKNIEKRPGYKHTPLGWIPEEWEIEKIGAVAKIKHGRDQKSVIVDNGVYPILGTGGEIGRTNTSLYNKPSVLIGRKGTIDLPRYMDTPFWTVDTLFYTEVNKNAFPKWLFYSFETINWYKYNEASGVPSLSSSTISGIQIPLPPLPEQRKIAAILSTWDDAIQQTQALIKQIEQRNKGLAQQLLKPKKEWKEVKMSTLFERITDKNEEGNDNVVTISAQRGFVKQETFFKKRVASDTLHNYFLVENGDFCYNKSYSTGYDWGATKRLKDFDKAVVTTLYICFRIKDETKTSGAFFEHFFEAGILDKGLSQIAHEGGRAHGLLNVTPHDFFSLKISVPDIKEQQAIAAVLDKAHEELKQQEQCLTALQQQKKGLMQQLLTGAVRVKIDNE